MLPHRQALKAAGPVFVDLSATALCTEYGSRPIGLRLRQSSFGDGRLDQRGLPSQCRTDVFTRRNNAVTKKSFPAMTYPPASRCGDTATMHDSMNQMPALVRERHRLSAMVACIRKAEQELSTHSML